MNKPFAALLLAAALIPLLDGLNTLHGQRIADPYRWLENANSAETKAFVEAENKVAMDYLKQDSKREAYKQTAGQLQEDKELEHIYKGSKYYFTTFLGTGSSEVRAIYRQKSLKGKQELFIDKHTLSKNGTLFVGAFEHSPSGKFLAYSTGPGFSEKTIRVVCTEDVEGLCKDKGHTTDVVQGGTRSHVTWTNDERGFFYTKSAKPSDKQASSDADPDQDEMVYYHRLGTQQQQDQLITLPSGAAGRITTIKISSDGKWLMIDFLANGTVTLWVAPMDEAGKGVHQKLSFRKLVNTGSFVYSYLATIGSRFYFSDTRIGSQSKVVAYDVNAPNDGFVGVIPAGSKYEISSAHTIAHKYVLVEYFQNGVNAAAIHDLATGKHVRDIELPPGMKRIIETRPQENEIFFNHESLLNSQVVYRYTLTSKAPLAFHESKLPGFDASTFEMRQVSVAGKNGASFPMFIAARKGIQLDGSHPTLLRFYPQPSPINGLFNKLGAAFMKHFRGVYAFAHIGYGSPEDGATGKDHVKYRFQNYIDSIKCAAVYLAQHNYTKPELLIIHGRGSEGTAVAAAVNQAPDHFGCALIEEGIMDLPGLSRNADSFFSQSTFGKPEEKEDFDHMRLYSPLQHVDGTRTYPAMLLTTSPDANFVSPWHSYKMAAELQHKLPKNPRPLMLRVEDYYKGNTNVPRALLAAEMVDELAFIATSLGLQSKA
ncbi:prolyl oligopeptidase [Syncephalis pseudoplumigaleata]|uniref:Prolyl endopeptidase n=1 Tax=Syncephalis pseudoplumigaleata TaxID=1712513 RepID=A0A4P9YT40_9FUNG|nr:prolyl oligopeptidase [Syncephalis pseudoplumigaleata]|eukprot:RKP23057.1 prolyl oligopeptidase [Syncephalis pseudoplumigaleata]